MKLRGPEYVACDVLVIGGGGAGLRAAIQAQENGASVLLVSKSLAGLGNNTVISKAALAAAAGWGNTVDSPEIHIRDTLEAGRFINDLRLVERIAKGIIDEVAFLEKSGVPFDKEGDKFLITRAPGHTHPRSIHGKNHLGTAFTLPLKEYAAKMGVSFMDRVFITRLFSREGGVSAAGIDRQGHFLVFTPKAVVLATGGFGQLYLHTNNAAGITGDGHVLAFQLGVPLRDMEFVQFYPTAIGGTRILTYETFVFRSGATLKNCLGENVIERHGLGDPMLMTRDRVARAIMTEILEGRDIEGGVIMDLRSVPEEALQQLRPLLPPAAVSGQREFVVSPTAHFCIGGVVADEETQTSVPGLFACGEVSGGAHGANRLASNSLSEVFVMGSVAGKNAALLARETSLGKPDPAQVAAEKARLESLLGEEEGSTKYLLQSLKEVAWYHTGIIRCRSGLEKGIESIGEIRSLAGRVRAADIKGLISYLELDNMLLVAETVSQAALKRTESRGAHYREDYPEEDPDWQANLFLTNRRGTITLEKRPVPNIK